MYVNHELLLFKLNYYGRQRVILDWFKSCLYRVFHDLWKLLQEVIS